MAWTNPLETGSIAAIPHWTKTFREIGWWACVLAVVGLTTSPALLSIGAIGLSVAGFLSMPPRMQWRRFMAHRPAVLLSLLFVLQTVSGLWTLEENAAVWAETVKIKLPLFSVPYAMAVLGPFSLRRIRILLLLLLASVCLVAIGTVLTYLGNADTVEQEILMAKEMKVWLGMNHIYFSIVAGFSVIGGFWMLRFRSEPLFKGSPVLIAGLTLAIFLMMHIMTTRTGLVGLYLTALVMGLVYVFQTRRYLLGVGALLVLVLVPVLGYLAVPSFRMRIESTRRDVNVFMNGEDPNYMSVATRLESWKTAFHIFQDAPVLGVGMGDLKPAMHEQYLKDASLLCPENYVLPHNQLMQNLAGFGLMGASLFVLAWLYPVLDRRWGRGFLFWGFWLNYSFAMAGESTMERQAGVIFLAIFLMLSLAAAQTASNGSASTS